MKKLFISVAFLALIIVAAALPSWQSPIKLVNTSPLGNNLCSYFYYINTDYRQYENLTKKRVEHISKLKDTRLKDFYRQWKWDKQTPLNYDYVAVPEFSCGQLDEHGKPREGFLQFWQSIRPQVRQFYAETLNTNATKNPVVHFRCSDSPHNKHPNYHLTKPTTVKWMADQIKARGFDEIVLLSCNLHNRKDKNSCAKYADFYTQIFNAAGLSVTTQCNTILEDFELMVSTPLLVALNTSSYSFIAGIAKNPNDYISCNPGFELNGKYILQTEADWIMSFDAPLLHKDVIDYNDAEDVLAKLAAP